MVPYSALHVNNILSISEEIMVHINFWEGLEKWGK